MFGANWKMGNFAGAALPSHLLELTLSIFVLGMLYSFHGSLLKFSMVKFGMFGIVLF